RDRGGAACRMPHPAAEHRAYVLEQLLVGLHESLLQLLWDGLAPNLQIADLDSQLDGRLGTLLLLGWLGLDRAVGDRVDLFKDARHRREVGGFDLQQLGDYLLGVAAKVGKCASQVERRELNEQRKRVG